VLNVSSADVPDVKVLKMIKRAEVALELELNAEIDYANCSEAQKEAITVLAAINALCYLSGGSAVGLSFSVGDLSNTPVLAKTPSLEVLQGELERILGGLKEPYVGRV
jgi:hypothetical protein